MIPMNLKSTIISTGILLIATLLTTAQITERERPAEWDKLVPGARFMDRFLPMHPVGELTSDTWGAPEVVPRYTDNGLEDNLISYWGGNVIVDENGKYNLFVCGWPEISPKGHMYWFNSTVYQAIADNSFGPYKVRRAIGPGHNPEIFQLKDGRYVIYIIDGYYISKNLNGPYERKKFEFNPRDRKIIEGLSNVTFAQREDGTYLAVCRGGGIWFSETGESSYNQVTDKRVYPPVEGRFEDPVVWRTNIQYHLIVNDWLGRIAWYLRSKDGVNWKTEPGEAYLPGLAVYEDGTKVDWFKYERLKFLQDEYGRATQAHFAVIDTIKWNDLEYDNHSSKHIVIPVVKGRLLSVLNEKPLTAKTKTIEVKIEAEEDFNPNTDIDLESLRFGASEEVNFGRGCKLKETKKSGDDLILVFDGSGNGFTDDNFAGKLLGKTSKGELLFGYSRLPGVEYIEPILSARQPKVVESKEALTFNVEVQNFGQVASEKAKVELRVEIDEKMQKIASGTVIPLNPFEKTTLGLPSSKELEKGIEYKATVIIKSGSLQPVTFDTTILL